MFSELLSIAARKSHGQTYRKKLGVYNYKIGHQEYHRQPGTIPVQLKESLRKVNTNQSHLKIRQLEQEHGKLLGSFQGRKFVFDKSKVPVFQIPDLTNFDLKPYVSYHSPKIDIELKKKMQQLNNFDDLKNLVSRSDLKLLPNLKI